MKMSSKLSLCAVSAVVFACAGTAQAQLVGRGAATRISTSAPSSFVGSPVANQNGVITNTQYSTRLTGDASVVHPLSSSFSDTLFEGFDAFDVGPLPVEVSNLRLSANYKIVNSGGPINGTIDARLGYSVSIRQFNNPYVVSGSDPYVMTFGDLRPVLSGNGFFIDSFTRDGGFPPFVLAAGVSYYFYITARMVSSYPLGSNSPVYGNTLEFGGPLSGGSFTGFEAAMDYRTVPTPGAAVLLGLAGSFAARRRRAR